MTHLHTVSEGTASAVRIQRFTGLHRVAVLTEAVPFKPKARPLRLIRITEPPTTAQPAQQPCGHECASGSGCFGHPDCTDRECPGHPDHSADHHHNSPLASARFWRWYVAAWVALTTFAAWVLA